MKDGVETERKYLIRRPQPQALLRRCGAENVIHIEQTYLAAPEGLTRRVRSMERQGQLRYVQTEKQRLSPMSSREREWELSREDYLRQLQTALPDHRTIRKTRYCLPYQGHLFEIDLYDFWQQTATMEVELQEEAEAFSLPPEIEILAEVTGDRRFSNAALRRHLPDLSPFWEEQT